MKKTVATALCVVLMMGTWGRAAHGDEESERTAAYRQAVEQSIDKALNYLAEQMQAGPQLYKDQYGNTNAIAGLVGMAFLSRGYIPDDSRYGKCINMCADHILDSVDPSKNPTAGSANGVRVAGYLGSDHTSENMYGHAICTLFLSEISGMVDEERQKKIDAVLPKALKLLLDAQRVEKNPLHKGGWRYMPNSADSDMSVTGWCVLALRSSRLNGAPVPTASIADAIGFIERMRSPDGSFGYSAPGDGTIPSRTGVAVLCRELTGHHDDEMNRKAADTVLIPLRSNGWSVMRANFEEYATYYCSQAMFQLGGKSWEDYAEQMYKYLLPAQEAGGSWSTGMGRAYPTAMYVLALTVSCRQLPIYQR